MRSLRDIEVKILLVIGALLAAGLILIFTGFKLGILLAAAGVAAIAGGWTKFKPSKPYEVGAVTIRDEYLKEGLEEDPEHGGRDTRKTVSVHGISILAPYFPFFIDAVRVDMTSQDWVFDVTIQSVEDRDPNGKIRRSVPVKGKILIVVAPDENHLNSFAQSGSDLKEVRQLVGGIPYREVQELVYKMEGGENNEPGLNQMEMVQQGDLISNELEKRLMGCEGCLGIFEDKSFGIICKKVQVIFEVNEDFAKAMIDAAKVSYQVAARDQEYQGDVDAALRFQEQLGVTAKEAWDMAVTSRLMRDGKLTRDQIEGLGKPVGVVPFKKVGDGGGGKGDKKHK